MYQAGGFSGRNHRDLSVVKKEEQDWGAAAGGRLFPLTADRSCTAVWPEDPGIRLLRHNPGGTGALLRRATGAWKRRQIHCVSGR